MSVTGGDPELAANGRAPIFIIRYLRPPVFRAAGIFLGLDAPGLLQMRHDSERTGWRHNRRIRSAHATAYVLAVLDRTDRHENRPSAPLHRLLYRARLVPLDAGR
jgi:hypothetical protein